MKTQNIRILMAALAMLAATSCQKEGVRTVTATFEQFESGSKAYIDDDYYACWEADDEVAVNGISCAVTLASGSAQVRSAQIVVPSDLAGQNLLAFYPADKISDMTVDGGIVDFPHIQTYREDSDGKQVIDNPMAAYCLGNDDELTFRNLGSLLKVTITDNNKVIKAIQVKGIDNQMLCGKSLLKFNSNGEPRLAPCTDGFNSVTLRFPEAVSANGRSFYIVLPPNTNFETLTIAVLANGGTAWATHAKTAYMGRMLPVNHIAAISYDLSHENFDFVADWTIRYSATAQVTPQENTDWGTFGAAETAYNFSGSKGLIVFNDVITQIGHEAFQTNQQLQSIKIPVSVTTIGYDAFWSCKNLTSVEMTGVTTIQKSTFLSCQNLTTVEMPQATTFGYWSFKDCYDLSHVYSKTAAPTIETGAFSCVPESAVLHLPSSLEGSSSVNWSGWPGTIVYDYDD